ncbi:MAG TPA: alpha/beta hydrolase [Allosphingosinicella sp.]|nr:alpha/beta hydrolase [Allosphingosinicella sp.]
MRSTALLFMALFLASPAPAQRARAPVPAGTVELSYGEAPRQRLDFTRAEREGAPLVLFVHGGGWMIGDKRIAHHMAAYFHGRGHAFAAVNYRLVPQATPAEQAADVAAALARLVADADRLGVDRRRIMLIGHSAGAHLAALVGTDPSYLRAHRLPVSTIDGIVLLDGAGYDVPAQMGRGGPLVRRMYARAFGGDPAFQRRVSPAAHAAAPNAGRFLILHIMSRPDDSGAQSESLGAALRAAGTEAEVVSVEGSHGAIFRQFGRPGHAATRATDAFADAIFGAAR